MMTAADEHFYNSFHHFQGNLSPDISCELIHMKYQVLFMFQARIKFKMVFGSIVRNTNCVTFS